MSERTVISLMADIAAHVNQEATAPDVDSDEYNLFLAAINRSEGKWGDSDYNWESLRKIHQTTALQSGTSVALPNGLRKLSGHVLIDGIPYMEIRPQDVYLHTVNSQYVVLNRPGGYMTISPARPTTCTVAIPYHSKPTSLASTLAVPMCPSDEFLISNSSAILLFGRSDPRYSELRDEADSLLEQMVGQEVSKLQQFDSNVKGTAETRGFVAGVDF